MNCDLYSLAPASLFMQFYDAPCFYFTFPVVVLNVQAQTTVNFKLISDVFRETHRRFLTSSPCGDIYPLALSHVGFQLYSVWIWPMPEDKPGMLSALVWKADSCCWESRWPRRVLVLLLTSTKRFDLAFCRQEPLHQGEELGYYYSYPFLQKLRSQTSWIWMRGDWREKSRDELFIYWPSGHRENSYITIVPVT